MNARQAKWIVEKLCPFILREHGRGFAMEVWQEEFDPGQEVLIDDVYHKVPSCGTICCIGGSIQCLMKTEVDSKVIGLNDFQGSALYYGWADDWGWPEKFRRRYKMATTAIAKARVAVSLLKLVAKTRGKCLYAD